MTIGAQFPRHLALWENVQRYLNASDLAHEHLHIQRVYKWCLLLADEAGADKERAGAAALVHDMVNIPKDSPKRSEGGSLSATASAPILQQVGYTNDEVTLICEGVRTSSWSKGLEPTSPIGRVLQDADRLDAIGAIGIIRTFATAQKMATNSASLSLYEPTEPIANIRPSQDKRFAVDHFTTKLLKLKDGMHTKSAKVEANRRHQQMVDFLAQLQHELK